MDFLVCLHCIRVVYLNLPNFVEQCAYIVIHTSTHYVASTIQTCINILLSPAIKERFCYADYEGVMVITPSDFCLRQ